MTDTQLLEALIRYSWCVLPAGDGWVVETTVARVVGSGVAPRAAIVHAIARLEADVTMPLYAPEAPDAQ